MFNFALDAHINLTMLLTWIRSTVHICDFTPSMCKEYKSFVRVCVDARIEVNAGFRRLAREFLFSSMFARESSKRVSILDKETGTPT